MSGRWVILTVCLDRDGERITAVDGTSGARVSGNTVAGTLYLLGNEIEHRYRDLAALPDPWPHEARSRDRLARFFEEVISDQRPMPYPRAPRRADAQR